MKRCGWAALYLCCWTVLLSAIAGPAISAQQMRTLVTPHADPFITLHPVGGQYLLLATTGKNITLWSGPTVADAGRTPHVLYTPADGLEQLWSPTLWHMGGRWWIYFTAQMPGKKHAIYALESDKDDPLGSYTFRGALALGQPAIDPSILVSGGTRYLMYVTVDGGENAIRIVRLAGPMQPEGQSTLIAEPQAPWEKGAGSTRTYPVNEGPTALYHEGHTFIVFSGSDTASPAYCLGLLTLTGADPMQRQSWTKARGPVFSAAPGVDVYGPGRGTFAEGKDGTMWLLYAAKATSTPTAAGRETWAQSFTWDKEGAPVFGQPAPQASQQAAGRN